MALARSVNVPNLSHESYQIGRIIYDSLTWFLHILCSKALNPCFNNCIMYQICNNKSTYVQLYSYESFRCGNYAMVIQLIFMCTFHRLNNGKYKEIIWYSFHIHKIMLCACSIVWMCCISVMNHTFSSLAKGFICW